MQKIALTLPGWQGQISAPTDSRFPQGGFKLTDAIFAASDIAILIGGSLMFVWAIWGVFDYIKAEGNKEALAKARKKIQWAVVGFIILILSFFISDYLQSGPLPLQPVRTIQPLSL